MSCIRRTKRRESQKLRDVLYLDYYIAQNSNVYIQFIPEEWAVRKGGGLVCYAMLDRSPGVILSPPYLRALITPKK